MAVRFERAYCGFWLQVRKEDKWNEWKKDRWRLWKTKWKSNKIAGEASTDRLSRNGADVSDAAKTHGVMRNSLSFTSLQSGFKEGEKIVVQLSHETNA